MTQTAYGVLVGVLLTGFVLLTLTGFLMQSRQTYDSQTNATSVTRYFNVNATYDKSNEMLDSMKESESQTANAVNIFKNAPGAIKAMTLQAGSTLVGLLNLGADVGVPGWVLMILLTLVLCTVLFILLKTVFFGTP